jgi:hypothetical protein
MGGRDGGGGGGERGEDLAVGGRAAEAVVGGPGGVAGVGASARRVSIRNRIKIRDEERKREEEEDLLHQTRQIRDPPIQQTRRARGMCRVRARRVERTLQRLRERDVRVPHAGGCATRAVRVPVGAIVHIPPTAAVRA